MQDEACRSFRDGTAGERCEGVDRVPHSPIIHWPNPATLGAVHCASPTGRLHEVEETFEQTTVPCRAHSAKKLAQHGPFRGLSAKKLAQHGPFRGLSAKKLAQQAQKRRIWGVLSAQGELFRTSALTQRAGRTFSRPNETATTKTGPQRYHRSQPGNA